MNERTMRDRLNALGPLVLRLGLAAVLLQSGLQHASGLWSQPASETSTEEFLATGELPATTAAITSDRLNLSMDWGTLLGIGELGTAGLLVVGLFTRLTVIPMLAFLGFGLATGFPESLPNASNNVMLLLGVAGLSLLASGGGCLCLGRRRPRTQHQEIPVRRERKERSTEFVRDRKSILERIRDRFPRRQRTQPAFAMPLKRKGWWR